ncbi:hypothetical protein Kpol_370p9 [Vanderwaltozyma polyspora DSM 70294]|uniref:Pre-mRNA-splicing factor ISY1 n=1 Tax=Vanderwaltozyma polyspora (strain ATCC 22028 / DSM 70294 / BCRC 21397 / CBS 2163 / NBRC 10782 / NRRL Y-8283 / UCD 57-17) TaxID=436907 RepID=A7TSI2_VANPO|nr:uncharacterized protein Kpol_370p9 [Vanderwaltozyma polyspora DSM 70294]EDO14781.1 hypothetical protein Kpol_370p9 [Vanderwaltozyma polyspora DSM 70294]
MSRNVDKANSLLVKYQEAQAEEKTGYKDYSRYKRPTNVSKVQSLQEALEWRKQLMHEFKDKSSRMYNPWLNDSQLIELNDELNELLREKSKWDWHISNRLGDTKPTRSKNGIVGGKLIMGKRYFGRALELPSVKEMIKNQDQALKEKKADNNLVDMKLIPKDKRSLYFTGTTNDKAQQNGWNNYMEQFTETMEHEIDNETLPFDDDIPVPSLEDMEKWLVARRKQKLLEQIEFD